MSATAAILVIHSLSIKIFAGIVHACNVCGVQGSSPVPAAEGLYKDYVDDPGMCPDPKSSQCVTKVVRAPGKDAPFALAAAVQLWVESRV